MSEKSEKRDEEKSLLEQYEQKLAEVSALLESADVADLGKAQEAVTELNELKDQLEASEAAEAELAGLKEQIASLTAEEVVVEETIAEAAEGAEIVDQTLETTAVVEEEKVEEAASEEVVEEKVETEATAEVEEKVAEEAEEKEEVVVDDAKEAETETTVFAQDKVEATARKSTGIMDLFTGKGDEFSTHADMIGAFSSAMSQVGSGSDGEMIRVGKVVEEKAPVELTNDYGHNLRALSQSAALYGSDAAALNASICSCQSLDTIRDIQSYCNSSTGLFTLPSVAAPRGGINYQLPSNACGIDYETFLWEETCDPEAPANPDKVCNPIPCGEEESAIVSGFGWCFEATNMFARFNPEQFNYYLGEAACEFRFRDAQRKLDLVLSHPRLVAGDTCTAQAGNASFEIYKFLALKVSKMRRGLRNYSLNLQIVAPTALRQALAANAAAGNGVTLDAIASSLNLSVSYVDHWQEIDDADECNQFRDEYTILIQAPGAFRELDGGEIDFGLVRDSELNKQNKFKIQFEKFNGVAFTAPDCAAELCTIGGLCFDGREAPRGELLC